MQVSEQKYSATARVAVGRISKGERGAPARPACAGKDRRYDPIVT